MELLLANLTSGSDSLILRSVHIFVPFFQRFFYRLVVQNIQNTFRLPQEDRLHGPNPTPSLPHTHTHTHTHTRLVILICEIVPFLSQYKAPFFLFGRVLGWCYPNLTLIRAETRKIFLKTLRDRSHIVHMFQWPATIICFGGDLTIKKYTCILYLSL